MHETACHCLALRRAARTMTGAYDAALGDLGLTVAQFALLRGIQKVGPASISELAEAVRLDRTTLGRNLDPLVSMGLVDRVAGDKDGRERRIKLTGRGRTVIKSALPLWRETQARVEAALGADKVAALHALLADIDQIAQSSQDRASS